MRAFVAMRKIIQENYLNYSRLDTLERRHFATENKIEQVFKALERKDVLPSKGVFFDGQVFDAYELTSKIIRSAKNKITLIDNYIDESTLTLLTKKNKNVKVLMLTKNPSKQLSLYVHKVNEQYSDFTLKLFDKSHDRF